MLALTALCAPLAAAQEQRARLRFEPPQAAVGEPVRAILSVAHARGMAPSVESLGLDDTWLVFETGARRVSSEPADPARETSTWVFEVASLEAGERKLSDVPLKLGDLHVPVEAAALAVRSVLGADEDSARPLATDGELDLDAAVMPWLAYALGALALVAVGLIAWLVARRRRPAVEALSAPSTRLAVLESRPLDTAQDVQAAHFALTRLLREAADLRVGQDRSGLTDEEWRLAASAQFDEAGLAPAELTALEQLLARAGEVKYGGERPTHWATREALAGARLLAARLEPKPEQAA
jgi:hypothetical protein